MDRSTQILAADDQIVSYETAVLAKNKGFNYVGATRDYGHLCYIDNGESIRMVERAHGDKTLAPTQTMLARWLRENHDIDITLEYVIYDKRICYKAYVNRVKLKGGSGYEDTLEYALEYALNLLPDVKLTMH